MKISKLLQNQKSQAIIIAIIVIAFVLILGAGLLFHARSYKAFSKIQTKVNGAYSLAKSGLGIAKHQIGSSSGGPSGSCSGGSGGSSGGTIPATTYTLGSGTVTIKATNGAITSTGNAGGAVRVLTETVPVPAGGTPVSTWSKSYGGAAEDDSWVVLPTADGGYMVGAYTLSWGAGNEDIAMLKLKADGTLDTAFGSTGAETFGGSKTDRFDRGLRQTSDGGYIIGGRTYSFISGGSSGDFLAVKTTNTGNITWAKVYRSNDAAKDDQLIDLCETVNSSKVVNGYLLAGQIGSARRLLIKTNLSGAPVTDGSFGGTFGVMKYGLTSGFSINLASVRQTFDNGDPTTGNPTGYIMGGLAYSSSSGPSDFNVIKINMDGTLDTAGFGTTSSKSYGTSAGDDVVYSVQQTSDGGYILGGISDSFSGTTGSYDFMIIKIKANGDLDTSFGGTGVMTYDENSQDQRSFSPILEVSDGYILGGYSTYASGSHDFSLIKIYKSGGVAWSKRYSGSLSDQLFYIGKVSDGGFILGGRTTTWTAGNYDMLLIKVDASGNLCCSPNISQNTISVAGTSRSFTPRNENITAVAEALNGAVQDVTATLTKNNPTPSRIDICN